MNAIVEGASTNIDTRELDRLLCERLGIEPLRFHVSESGYRFTETGGIIPITPEYPAVSTDGNAMPLLIAALGKDGRWVKIAAGSPEAGCRAEVLNRYLGDGPYRWNLSMPAAVALAAAAALGVAVPLKEKA